MNLPRMLSAKALLYIVLVSLLGHCDGKVLFDLPAKRSGRLVLIDNGYGTRFRSASGTSMSDAKNKILMTVANVPRLIQCL